MNKIILLYNIFIFHKIIRQMMPVFFLLRLLVFAFTETSIFTDNSL